MFFYLCGTVTPREKGTTGKEEMCIKGTDMVYDLSGKGSESSALYKKNSP